MVVTIETDAGITGIGEGGSKDMLEQSRRPADRPRSAVHRAALAGHDPRLLLSAGPREDPRASARSIWRCGTSRAKSRPAGARAARRHGAQLLRVLQHRRHHSGHHAGHEHQGARPRHHRGGLSRLPHGRHGRFPPTPLTTPTSASTSCTTNACRRAKASARTATGASISTSASISPTPSAAAI